MRKRVIQTSFYLIQNTDLLWELLPLSLHQIFQPIFSIIFSLSTFLNVMGFLVTALLLDAGV
jgi:hypothetical protein